ncbi:MAG: hypothetical protein ABEK10_00240 [Candidatus Nanosalina sp.]
MKKLQDFNWTKEDLSSTSYAGKYTTHEVMNRRNIEEQLENPAVDFEFGEHILEYNGKEMDVRLDVTDRWAQFMYDETFEEELGDEDFQDVVSYFITPTGMRYSASIFPE